MPHGRLPVLNMKKMRCLFLVLVLGCGVCAQRAQGQVAAQNITFSIICQYITNIYATNISALTTNENQQVTTVIVNSHNLAKAAAIDLLGTNWTKWQGASFIYEQNMITSNQGIYLRLNGKQTNVSQFFGDNFTNMFTQNVSNVYSGTNYASLPLIGGIKYDVGGVKSTNYTASDNLAYLTFSTTNISFSLFGYSQGSLVNVIYDREGDTAKVDQPEIVGAGTFSLNVTTNIYPYLNITKYTPATNYTGLAHGTVMFSAPYHFDIEPPEGP
jgi:hypothetical protein